MATIYNGKMAKYEDGKYSVLNLWDDLEAAFDWYDISGTDNDKKFKVSENIELELVHFFDASSSNLPKIIANVNDVQYEIFGVNYSYWSLNNRPYKIIVSDRGDIIFKTPSGTYDNNQIYSSANFIFAIVAVQNTLNAGNAGYGIYIPYSTGGVNSSGALPTPFIHTPKYLLTDDTTTNITNVGRAGSTTSTTLQYVINEDAKITALVPICANCSECVSTNSYLMLIGNSYRSGETVLNGEKYYCDGGFCMYEGAAE